MRRSVMFLGLLISSGIIVLLGSTGLAQTERTDKKARPAKSQPTAKARKKVPDAYQPPEIDPSLPNVLLLGDSISIGYMLPVRKTLAGEANVFRPATNCGPTINGIAQIETWIGDRKWDVVHFNFGLHDLKYMGTQGENLADPKDPASHQQVPLPQYTANLKQIAERLKETGATVIWCQTTPVPEGAEGRVPGDEVRYNQAAAEVMAELGGIEFDNLYEYAVKNVLGEQRKANVHFSPAGSDQLAEHVVASVRRALKSK